MHTPFESENPNENLEKFTKDAEQAAHEVPLKIRRELIQFKRYGNKEGYLVIKGLSADKNLCKTPLSYDKPEKKSFVSEFNLATIGSVLGDIVTYEHLNKGAMFHDVCPLKSQEQALSSRGSKVDLHLHTDLAFHPCLPDYLLLFCLRQNQPPVPTCVSSVHHALKSLTARQIAVLRHPLFQVTIDDSFSKDKKSYLSPVIFGEKDSPFLRLDSDLMQGINEEAKQAFSALIAALNTHKEQVSLNPGDLLIIDNKVAVHGRNSFKANFDGTDRWLQRVYVQIDRSKTIVATESADRCIRHNFNEYKQPETLASKCLRVGFFAVPALIVGAAIGYTVCNSLQKTR